MSHKSKLLAGVAAAGTVIFSTGVLAGDMGKDGMNAKGKVYGDFRWSLAHTDEHAHPASVGASAPADLLDANNNRSVIGVKASTSHGGLTAFVKYERDMLNDTATGATGAAVDNTRKAYLGIEGGFGTLLYGQAETAYAASGRKLDPFFNTSLSGFTGAVGAINGASYGYSALTNDNVGAGLLDNQVAYTTPSFGGLTVNAAVFADEGAADRHDLALGAEFSNAGLTAGVQILDINSGVVSTNGSVQNFSNIGFGAGATAEVEATRLYAGLDTKALGVNVSWEKLDLHGGLKDRDYYAASAWLGVTASTRLALGVGKTENTPFEGNAVTVGVFHDVMDNLTVHAGARKVDRQQSSTTTAANLTSTDAVSLGFSYKFNLGFGS